MNSSAEDFNEQLSTALNATGATLAFDAIGGGKLGNAILMAMEAAAVERMTEWSRYGSNEYKQLYIYGALDLHQQPSIAATDFHGALVAGCSRHS